MFGKSSVAILTAGCLLLGSAGCDKPNSGSGSRSGKGLQITGSDTMVNLMTALQGDYNKAHKDVLIQVKGGGSGVGIKALIDGKVDICPSSRPMKDAEKAQCKEKQGKDAVETVIGLDALAIYVNKENPLETISVEELAEIFGENGTISQWKDLGIDHPNCKEGKIIAVTRQSSSGTYLYFKEAVIGEKRQYKQGLNAQGGSADLVTFCEKTPCALGYSGMGYAKDTVKLLKVSQKKGGPGVAPSIQSARDKSYPIARKLYIYTLGEPQGEVKKFIDWVLSADGQKVVEASGYVPNEVSSAAP